MKSRAHYRLYQGTTCIEIDAADQMWLGDCIEQAMNYGFLDNPDRVTCRVDGTKVWFAIPPCTVQRAKAAAWQRVATLASA
jgi:hypothetical protein